MDLWAWIVAGAFLVAGAVLAIATTTSNRLRWAVLAPLVWGTGTLFIAVMTGDWGPIAVTAGMYFYAAINYREIRKRARSA
jgi:hypothetical protein